jgi:hypothetical protein
MEAIISLSPPADLKDGILSPSLHKRLSLNARAAHEKVKWVICVVYPLTAWDFQITSDRHTQNLEIIRSN